MALELLIVSDRYDIEKLLKQGKDYLINTLSNDDSMEYLRKAIFYNAYNLKNRAFQYIVTHANDSSKKLEFKAFLEGLPQDMVADIVGSLAENKSMYELFKNRFFKLFNKYLVNLANL